MADVTNNLRRQRFEHGEITQEEVAKHVGVSRQTIIAIESGRYTPSLGLAFRLARMFKCRIEDLFSLKEPE
ncbi:MAG: helix-turn-helix transcriptional regulator [Tepidisphaeraceae bacterium]